MLALYLILYVVALVCFLMAAFGVAASRVNLIGLGLAFMVLVPIIQLAQKL